MFFWDISVGNLPKLRCRIQMLILIAILSYVPIQTKFQYRHIGICFNARIGLVLVRLLVFRRTVLWMDLSSLESQLFCWWWWCWPWWWSAIGWWQRRGWWWWWNTKTEEMGNYWGKFWSKVINETLGCINLITSKPTKN